MRVETQSGAVIDLGVTETTPTIGITDFSKRSTDAFGVTRVVGRGFSRRMSVRLAVPTDSVGALQRRLADLRGSVAHWLADDQLAWLQVHGFFKDFELDLAVPPNSYCRLTVEGLAQTEVVADQGGDPAPAGRASTFSFLDPSVIDDAALISSSVPETDYAAWAIGTTYASGQRVIKASTHRIYESVGAGNVGHDPATSPEQWLEVGATNRWAMFDQALGSATTAAGGSLTVTLSAGTVDAVALLDVVASSVRVQAAGYDRTLQAVTGTALFLDLPAITGQITVTVTGDGQVAVGSLLAGRLRALGITEASPTASIIDFSKKQVDDFGEASVVQRSWAKRMNANALIRSDAVDQVANRIAAVRAKPCLWLGDSGQDSLIVYGFFRDFAIEVGEATAKLSLSIEGLSTAPAAIEGITKQQLVDEALAAKAAAAAALAAIGVITSDAFLSAGEKPQLMREVEAILAERPTLVARADALLVSRTAYQAAYAALIGYLQGLAPAWNDTATDTPIDPAAFTSAFRSYYDARSALSMAIADKAANNNAINDNNRVRYSRMEGGIAGYAVLYNPAALSVGLYANDSGPYKLVSAIGTFTGANQTFSVGTDFREPGMHIPVTPGERICVQLRTQIDVPDPGGTWEVLLGWIDAAGAPLGADRPVICQGQGDTAGVLYSLFVNVPAGAYGCWIEGYLHSGGPGIASIGIIEPDVTSAGALQTQVPAFAPGPGTEIGADLTTLVNASDQEFLHNYLGVLQPGQARPLTFTLERQNGTVTSGVSWFVTIISGKVNGIAAGTAVYPITGTGAGIFPVTSLESTTVLEIKAAQNGVVRPAKRITLYRTLADPPPAIPPPSGSSGGGSGTMAAKGSDWTPPAAVGFTEIGRLDFAAPGSGAVNCSASLTFTPSGSDTASATVQVKWERETAPGSNSWEPIGSTASGSTSIYRSPYRNPFPKKDYDPYADVDTYEPVVSPCTIQVTGAKSGLSGAQRVRLLAAVSNAMLHYVDGSASVVSA